MQNQYTQDTKSGLLRKERRTVPLKGGQSKAEQSTAGLFKAAALRSWTDQRQAVAFVVALVFVPAVVLLLATAALSVVKNVPVEHFMRDTTAVAKLPFYVGAISKVGIILWCFTAAACLLTSFVQRKTTARADQNRFFLLAGSITLVLMVDDFFLLHDEVIPDYLALPSEVTYTVYGIAVAAFFIYYRHRVYQSNYLILLLGMAFLAGSVATDVVNDNEWVPFLVEVRDAQFLLEDGLKLVGIAGWFGYFATECYAVLTRRPPRVPRSR